MKRIIFGLIIVLVAFILTSCPNPTTPMPDQVASTIIFADGATVTRQMGSGSYINPVTGDGTGAVSYSSGTQTIATINASSGEVTLLAQGSTLITANKAATATHSAVSNSYTLTVTELSPSTIVFTDVLPIKKLGSGTYINFVSGDGSGVIAYTSGTPETATVNPSTGEVTLVGLGTTVITATKAATATHAAVTNTYTLTITALTPSTIEFADGQTVSRMIGSGSYTNPISGDGTGTIIYTSGTTTTAYVNSNTGAVTPVGVGTTVITATKAATATHAAVTNTYTLTITALTPSVIVFADGSTVSKMINSGAYTNAVSGAGTGTVTYLSGTPATATVDAITGEVTLEAAGSTVITANKAATTTHGSATNSYTLTVTKISSTLVFADGSAVTKQLGSGLYTNAVSGDGSGTISYTSGTPATATVDAITGTITFVSSGTTVITATKAASATHAAVTNAYTLTVTPLTPSTIVFADGETVSRQIGSGSYNNYVTGEGLGLVTFTSSSPWFAAVDSSTGTVTLLAAGTTVITANKAATATHAAVSNSYALTVTKIPISIVSIPGVISPETGAIPVTMTIDTAQYTGTVSWSPNVGTFAAITVYTANIILTPKTDWTLTGLGANSFTVTGATVTHSANSGDITAVFPATSAAPIALLTIPGVTAPVRGATPVTTAIDTAQYTGTITWSPVDSSFAASKVYTATIDLTAKAGWTLSGVAGNSFTVTGSSNVSNTANSGVITAVFPATSAAPITLLAIPGVTAPVRGAIPVTTAIDTEQYAGSITWSPAGSPFAASTVYTANIVLTAKAGWTMTGVAANGFTVSGTSSVSNNINSGVVSAVFPATSAVPISLLAIPGITVPVRGATPVTTAINTTQYTGTIIWSPTGSTFAASTVYTANIVLTAKAGYTLTGVASNSFTVLGATATNTVDTGTVEALFPATLGDDYTSAKIGTLKYIPSGSFQRDVEALNISTVSTAFRMSAKEITRAQYLSIMGTDPSENTYSNSMSDPVQMVTWYDAAEFCNKLSVAEGLTAVYTITGRTPATGYPITAAIITVSSWTASGYRLPTEMEWMWAAMGATETGTNTSGYLKAFAGSSGANTIGNYAVFGYGSGQTGATTTNRSNPVGSKGANELGLYDMSGNVWEWCWDWYAYSGTYSDYAVSGQQEDYRGEASGSQRIRRGGQWGDVAALCAVAFRYYLYPDQRGVALGFRVVRP